MDNQIADKITEILIEKMGLSASEITPDANFIKDLGVDSLDFAKLTMEFEKAFDVSIPDSDAEKIATIGQAIDYIKNKVSIKN